MQQKPAAAANACLGQGCGRSVKPCRTALRPGASAGRPRSTGTRVREPALCRCPPHPRRPPRGAGRSRAHAPRRLHAPPRRRSLARPHAQRAHLRAGGGPGGGGLHRCRSSKEGCSHWCAWAGCGGLLGAALAPAGGGSCELAAAAPSAPGWAARCCPDAADQQLEDYKSSYTSQYWEYDYHVQSDWVSPDEAVIM